MVEETSELILYGLSNEMLKVQGKLNKIYRSGIPTDIEELQRLEDELVSIKEQMRFETERAPWED